MSETCTRSKGEGTKPIKERAKTLCRSVQFYWRDADDGEKIQEKKRVNEEALRLLAEVPAEAKMNERVETLCVLRVTDYLAEETTGAIEAVLSSALTALETAPLALLDKIKILKNLNGFHPETWGDELKARRLAALDWCFAKTKEIDDLETRSDLLNNLVWAYNQAPREVEAAQKATGEALRALLEKQEKERLAVPAVWTTDEKELLHRDIQALQQELGLLRYKLRESLSNI